MKAGNNKSAKILIFLILILTILIQSALIYSPINQIENGLAISATEVEDFSYFPINCSITNNGYGKAVLKFRLFDLFTLKSIQANIIEDEIIYLGGDPIGISLRPDGVIITGKSDVITKDGIRTPTKNADIAAGDVLMKLNKTLIRSHQDIKNFLASNNDLIIIATIRRGIRVIETPIEPAIDTLTNEKRLGLFIKEEISGVGTLTFIKADNMTFGALGHNVSESLCGKGTDNIRGEIYKCNIVGIQKGEKGNAGELRGYFSRTESGGRITKNNSFGIYGKADKSWAEGKQKVVMASRFSAKVGKAEIYTTIDGDKARKFEIEIIKLNYQKSEAEKGMVIRVTDKELLAKTGGIVQGMSGSPIVQDGKLIGAVTHVFLNDPSKGYGTYIDWMKNN
jgi:stage IV sporulation protein B